MKNRAGHFVTLVCAACAGWGLPAGACRGAEDAPHPALSPAGRGWGEGARQAALEQAAASADRIADRFERTWARYAIAEEWTCTDPARVAELADKLESWTAKRDLLSLAMYAWGRKDPKAAADWGLKFKQRTEGRLEARNAALHYAVVGMARQAPQLAEELIWKNLEEEGWGGHPREAPMAAARELARTDPAAALALAEKIKLEGHRVDALRGVLREWAAKDPQAAEKAFAGRNEETFRKFFPRDLAEGWARKDPRAAAEYAKGVADRAVKVLALGHVAQEMARTDGKAAAELCALFTALDTGKWHEQMARLGKVVFEAGEAFARADPEAAVRWAASLPEGAGNYRRRAYDGVAAGWACRDAKAALSFYLSPVGDAGELAQPAAKDKPAPSNRGTGAAFPALARELAKADVPSALGLVGRADSLVLKSNTIAAVAQEVARRDPAEAARIVEKWEGVTDYYTYRTGAAEAVASAWATKDAKAAAAWAAKLEPTRDRLAALRAVAGQWVRRQPEEATAWAKSLSDPQESVYALTGLASGLRGGDFGF